MSKTQRLRQTLVLQLLRPYKGGGYVSTHDVRDLVNEQKHLVGFDPLPVLQALHAAGKVLRIERATRGKHTHYGWALP